MRVLENRQTITLAKHAVFDPGQLLLDYAGPGLGGQQREAEERLETLLFEGLQSAETELTPADWSETRQEAIAQMKARRHRQ